ncbi:MAG: hypothetical protein ACRDAX_01200 [Propionibacteriaceae bacterium]
MPAFWRDYDRSTVTVQEAIGEWSLEAWRILEDVAARWRKTITGQQLGIEVQKRTGIMTSVPEAEWIGFVISLVAQRAHESHGPILTSFIVDDAGNPHETYREVLGFEGNASPNPGELRDHALESRMTCHRAYGAKIPASATALPRKRVAAAPATVVAPREPRPTPVCPRCYLVLPATGQCDNCF